MDIGLLWLVMVDTKGKTIGGLGTQLGGVTEVEPLLTANTQEREDALVDKGDGSVRVMPLALFLILVMVKGGGVAEDTEVEVVMADDWEEKQRQSICLDC